MFEPIEDLTKIALIVAASFYAFGAYARHMQPTWSAPLEKRRFAILSVLVLIVLALKVGEDVLGGESGPIDHAILMNVASLFPGSLTGFFEAVTPTGSSKFLFPLTSTSTVALLRGARRAL